LTLVDLHTDLGCDHFEPELELPKKVSLPGQDLFGVEVQELGEILISDLDAVQLQGQSLQWVTVNGGSSHE
jgi:hypothetical protein